MTGRRSVLERVARLEEEVLRLRRAIREAYRSLYEEKETPKKPCPAPLRRL